MTGPSPGRTARIEQLRGEARTQLARLVERHRTTRRAGRDADIAIAPELVRLPPTVRVLTLQAAVDILDRLGWRGADDPDP